MADGFVGGWMGCSVDGGWVGRWCVGTGRAGGRERLVWLGCLVFTPRPLKVELVSR